MIMQVCAVYDKKVGAYMQPMFFRSKLEAIRSFADACTIPVDGTGSSNFVKYPEDFHLALLGDFDDNTGTFVSGDGPSPLITALECVKAARERSVSPFANIAGSAARPSQGDGSYQ